MATVGDIGMLLMGAGGVLGPIFGASEAGKANEANIAAQRERDKYLQDLVSAGAVDAFGNRINFREGGTGPMRTELTGDTKRVADLGVQTALTGEEGRAALGGAGTRLASMFADQGVMPRAPLTREQATGISRADDARRAQALYNPAIEAASAIGQRTRGGMSNQANLMTQFQERLLPQIQIGGEERALTLQDRDLDRYKTQTAGLGSELIGQSVGYAPNIPGVSGLGGPALNKLGDPTRVMPGGMEGALASGAQSVGSMLRDFGKEQTSQKNFADLLTTLKSGNQGVYGGKDTTMAPRRRS